MAYYPPMPENKTPMLVVLILAIAIAVWFYFKGKNPIPDAPYIKGTAGLPAGFNPNDLADRLYDAMNSIFVASTTKEAVWAELLNLPTPDMMVLVYNTFNKKYGPKGKGSLTKWIDDEIVYNWGFSYKAKVVAKLRSLNCK